MQSHCKLFERKMEVSVGVFSRALRENKDFVLFFWVTFILAKFPHFKSTGYQGKQGWTRGLNERESKKGG